MLTFGYLRFCETLLGPLGGSEKSGGEVHSVGISTEAVVGTGVVSSRLEINKTLSFRGTWNKRDLTV